MTISAKAWAAYIRKLSALNEKAAEEMRDFVARRGFSDMDALIGYAYGLATKYGEGAAALAAEMYDAVAEKSGVQTEPAVPAPTASYSDVARTVQGVAKTSRNPEEMGGAVGRLVKQAGADTTLQNALRDGAEFAWVPSGDTCAFCITLASRGWQRASQKAIKGGHAEHIHSNCDCTYAIRFDGKGGVAGYDPDKYLRMYENAEGSTPKEKINAMRRENYAEHKEEINAQKRAAWAERPNISREKFTKYALNSTAAPDKAKAFQEALGYTEENCDQLIAQIGKEFDVDKCREKGNNEFGILYEQVMTITGVNGKEANVCTGWIKRNGESRLSLTSAYVTKKKVKRDD